MGWGACSPPGSTPSQPRPLEVAARVVTVCLVGAAQGPGLHRVLLHLLWPRSQKGGALSSVGPGWAWGSPHHLRGRGGSPSPQLPPTHYMVVDFRWGYLSRKV